MIAVELSDPREETLPNVRADQAARRGDAAASGGSTPGRPAASGLRSCATGASAGRNGETLFIRSKVDAIPIRIDRPYIKPIVDFFKTAGEPAVTPRTHGSCWPVAAVLALLWPLPAQAQHRLARAHGWIPSVYLVGDRITRHVDLRHPRGLTVQPLVADIPGGFTLARGRTPFAADDGHAPARSTFILARYDSGDAGVPPLPFLYSVPGDTAPASHLTNQLTVSPYHRAGGHEQARSRISSRRSPSRSRWRRSLCMPASSFWPQRSRYLRRTGSGRNVDARRHGEVVRATCPAGARGRASKSWRC